MHPSIITGLNGTLYQNFPNPAYGAWNQKLLGSAPYHYNIGGYQFMISPRPPGEQINFPYMGPSVPATFRK
ncbi:hypothetical protein WKH57_18485 [Niallia taxi]|uniref:hypothetical protein n=1 Tax=Niallia taxi TaxID=2499688 RepID=UPI00203F6F32|nr:hypothetical protein [Niallia taxi]MCM3213500.1 hypothetical protein [Niallia taxi]